VARDCLGCKQDYVHAQAFNIFDLVMSHGFGGGCHAAQAVFVHREIEVSHLAAPFHLDERNQPAPFGHDIDLANGRFHAGVED